MIAARGERNLTFKVQRKEKRIFTTSSEGHEEEKIKVRKIQILLSTDFTD